jgi:hypothetical protein
MRQARSVIRVRRRRTHPFLRCSFQPSAEAPAQPKSTKGSVAQSGSIAPHAQSQPSLAL